MEPDLHVLSGPSAGVQRTNVGADSLGSGPSPRGGESVPRRGQNRRRTFRYIEPNVFQHIKEQSTEK